MPKRDSGIITTTSAPPASGTAASATSPPSTAGTAAPTSGSESGRAAGNSGGGAVLDTTRSGLGVLLGAVQTEGAPRPHLLTDRGRPGLRFTMPAGGRRSEVLPPTPTYHQGDQVWLHYRAQLAGVPVDTTTWQLIAQFHQDANTGSPPIALEIGDGQLRLANQGTHQQPLGAITTNGTLDVVLHVVFSRDPAHAQVDVYRDGTPVLTGYHPPGGTLLDDGDYLKLGLYRDPTITTPSTVTATTVQVGPTRAAVDS